MSGQYDDIINLPHHQSDKHPRMAMKERAAQFSPFSALTGYGAVIAETGRLTDGRIELTDERKDEIDWLLGELLKNGKPAAVTFFEPDGRKEGGRYVTAYGPLKRVDAAEGIFLSVGGRKVSLLEILRVEEDGER